jgi:hypothetical protein
MRRTGLRCAWMRPWLWGRRVQGLRQWLAWVWWVRRLWWLLFMGWPHSRLLSTVGRLLVPISGLSLGRWAAPFGVAETA